MPQRFTATENAIERGLENSTPGQGKKLVQDWVEELKKADFTGAKGIAGDLEKLGKALDEDEPDAEKIRSLLGKLGEATLKAADKAEDDKVAEKVRALGEALTSKVEA